jgi:hypothetical protein
MPAHERSNYIRAADRALLWWHSGGMCCFPDCAVICVIEATATSPSAIIGQIAHIKARSDAGPRADPSLSDRERNAYSNLILFCPTHHTLVDVRPNNYTADTLGEWKTNREAMTLRDMAQAMPAITFVELEVVTQALVGNATAQPDSISLVPPRDKMAKNGLTTQTDTLFKLGLVQSTQVRQFVEHMTNVDSGFVSRLTSGFVNEYERQRGEGLEGDELFAALQRFAAQERYQAQYQCAGLAVLVYLFERCEVFEQ